MYKNLFILLLLLTVLSGCQKSRTDNILLNEDEYKFWYIKTSGNINPEFMYIDSYGNFCMLRYNPETGYFVPLSHYKNIVNLSGKWKSDSDSTFYLNDLIYSIKVGCDTLLYEDRLTYHEGSPEPLYYNKYIKSAILYNQETDESIVLRDTGLPLDLYEGYRSSGEKDRNHYEKWKKKIKKSIFLNGKDYKLWLIKEYNENYPTYYYYDKYGQHGLTYLSKKDWQFSDPNDAELTITGRWYQDKDIIYQYDNYPFKILNYNKVNETIVLYNIKQKYEQILTDPHMLPKR